MPYELHEAATRGDGKEVTRLLQEEHYDVNEFDSSFAWLGLWHTPLYYAVSNNHVEVAKILVNHNANVNGGYRPPLFAAVDRGRVQMVKWLLERGADPNKQEVPCGCTALHVAAEERTVDIVEILLAHGANPNIKDGYGRNALEIVEDKDSALYKMLLESSKNAGDKIKSKATRNLDYSGEGQGKDKLEAIFGDAMEDYFNESTSKPGGTVSVSFDVTLAQYNTKTKVEIVHLDDTGTSTKINTSQVMSKLDVMHGDIKNVVTTMKRFSLQDDQSPVTAPSKNRHKGNNKLQRLLNNLVELTKKLHNINFICDHLVQAQVITLSDGESIMAEQTDRHRASKLINKYLLKKDEHSIKVFCNALRKEGQNHLAAIIEG